MKKIIAFGASSSIESINRQFAIWAANSVENAEVKALNLNDFEGPIYSIDRENASGIPKVIMRFKEEIKGADGIVISLAEHNGNFSAAFKNLYDWMSRIDRSIWNELPMLLLSTSPGPGGGARALGIANSGFPHAGGKVVGHFSLPSFNQNFGENGISENELLASFNAQVALFSSAL